MQFLDLAEHNYKSYAKLANFDSAYSILVRFFKVDLYYLQDFEYPNQYSYPFLVEINLCLRLPNGII